VARSVSEYAERIASLTDGWLKPIFEDHDPVTGKLRRAALSAEDFERVRLGYACPECLVRFRTYLTSCPVCGHKRDLGRDIVEAAQEWKDHLRTRALAEQGLLPREGLPSMDKLLDEIASDPDVEHAPVRKLKPRRRG
jgi:hypothetical protein